MQVSYVLSSQFDYDRLFTGDAGAAFASDYGWPTATAQTLRDTSCDVAVVDQWFTPDEIDALRATIDQTKITFVLRLCDPYWNLRDHWWYRFVSEMLDHSRVHVMLNYQQAEITALFAARARRSQFVHAPYVYRCEKEMPIDHENRAHIVLFSGSRHQALYPLRAQMHHVASLWPPLRLMTRTLPHPGYPDIGQGPLRHAVVGDAYIARLAAFRFATVCSSRCRLEFLKYREFAYAGVVPLGNMPATLLDCPLDAWVPWRRNFVALTQMLRKMSATDTVTRAEAFRDFMCGRRRIEDMRAWVTTQLACLG